MSDDEEIHISEKAVGSSEYYLEGYGKCEEIITERVDPTDGTPIDHITYKPMVASRYTFNPLPSKKYLENIENIDWSS